MFHLKTTQPPGMEDLLITEGASTFLVRELNFWEMQALAKDLL